MFSRRQNLEASWSRTRAHLNNAFAQLPALPKDSDKGGSAGNYREWLDHNELELALDELEMLGEANGAGRKFWELLLSAAIEMKLNKHIMRYQKLLAR